MVNFLGPGAFGCARPASSRPTFTPANGAGDVDDWAKDCSSPLARDGTEWRAAWLNFLIANLRSVVSGAGVPQSNSDDAIIAKAIQSGGMNFSVATGSANNWTVALGLALASYRAGTVLWLRAPATNTATVVTVAVSGLASRRLKKADGTDPAIGDLVSGRYYPTIDDGTSIRVIGALASDYSQPMNQEFITASKSFIVPASTLWIEGVGGGGAGGASGTGTIIGIAGNMGAGGGAGGFFRKVVSGLTIGSTITATIGAGGTPVAGGGGGVGGNGGTTSFASHASASGGGGGAWGENTSQPGGSSGMGVGGDLNLGGAPGGRTGPNNTTPTASDILTIYGRGGSAFGGLSVLNLVSTGSPGLGFGTGGNGASGGSGVAGGAGAPGYIWVRW